MRFVFITRKKIIPIIYPKIHKIAHILINFLFGAQKRFDLNRHEVTTQIPKKTANVVKEVCEINRIKFSDESKNC
jgi:hypothetical protein